MKRKSVLISGAGIAGPALAHWLHRRGFEPVLIEQAAQFREGGYMIDFWSIGFDVAERMNLIFCSRAREMNWPSKSHSTAGRKVRRKIYFPIYRQSFITSNVRRSRIAVWQKYDDNCRCCHPFAS